MTLQSSVAADIPWGVIGELYLEGPLKAAPAILAAQGTFGRFFTYDANGNAVQGGTGALLGILANPKEFANTDSSFAASMTLPANAVGTFVQETAGIWVDLDGPATIKVGMGVVYATATGILSAYDQSGAAPGGSVVIPGARVERFNSTATANLAVISLPSSLLVTTAPL